MKQFLKISMAFLFLMLSNVIFGQPRDTVLNKYNGEENITALNSIKLTNGFHIKDGSVRIFISDFPQAPLSLNHSYNHVLLRTPRVAGVNRNNLYSTKPINEESLDVLYFDDLGRTIQQIRVAASPSFKDIVEHLEYDAYGRQDKNYMPYAENKENKGGYISEAKNQTFSFYKENSWDTHISKTARPFSQTNFEDSPLNRLLEQGGVGEDWQPETGHASKISYGTNVNSGSEAVKLWRINQTGDGASVSGVYAEGTLLRITKRDENVPIGSRKGSIEEYYNFNNDVVVQRVWISESEFRSTYYIYDDYDDLRYVLPPAVNEGAKLSSGGIDSFLENESTYKHYIYGYKYDQRRRLTEKKTPGRGIQKYVYNALEQLVLSQDSLLATQGKWNAFKYDVDGREILRGFYQDTRNRRQLQNLLDTVSSIQYEVRTSSELGYSMVVFPKTIDVHGVTHYDDYSFPGNKFGSSATQKVGVANVQGLPTGTLRKVIGDDKFLLSTYYYDKYGRNIRVVQEIHTGGTEISDTEYDFSGNVLSNTVSSKFSEGHTALQIKTRFKYDHVARLQNIYKKIGSGNEIILNQLDYNEIGQLKRKQLHSDDGGRSFLIGIDYEYNPRGWLTKISSPNFTEILKYQDGTHKQWNGNIANQLWGHSSAANNEFTYQYDSQNRLTEGKSTGIIMSEKISYDEIGNITELVRDNRTNTYNYEGNNLKKVTGHLNTQNYRYDGNGNTIFDGRNGFDYTYNYLDLPVEVKHGNILKLANVYDHDGNLLSKRLLENDIYSEISYIGSLEYLKIGESDPKLELIHTEEGIIQNNNGIYSYQYFLKDHLGNVRAVIDKHNSNVRVLQRHNYYPYGKFAPTGNIAGTNNYLYNGKEYLPGLGSATSSGQYDYGARYYDPEIARWGTIDPLAEATYSLSPYGYVHGNPIRFIDPDGRMARDFYDPPLGFSQTDGARFSDNTGSWIYSQSSNMWVGQNGSRNFFNSIPIEEVHVVGRKASKSLLPSYFNIFDDAPRSYSSFGNPARGKYGPWVPSNAEWRAIGDGLSLIPGANLLGVTLNLVNAESNSDYAFAMAGLIPGLKVGKYLKYGDDVANGVFKVEQYTLRALEDGFYPVMKRSFKEAQELVWLNRGDVWKFGTTKNPFTRYSQSFLKNTGAGLQYTSEFSGTLKQATILERMKILNFKAGTGFLPAGNKIVR